MYNKSWSQFETQALAFSILRKQLYPEFIVRGEHGIIRIYTPTADSRNPKLRLELWVKASDSPADSGFFHDKELSYRLVGGDTAYNILAHVRPLI